MTAIQLAALVLVALGGTAVVLTHPPLRQTLVLSIYGFALTILFFSFQAPDVALSEIVIGGIGMPLVILAALRKLADEEHEQHEPREPGERAAQDPADPSRGRER